MTTRSRCAQQSLDLCHLPSSKSLGVVFHAARSAYSLPSLRRVFPCLVNRDTAAETGLPPPTVVTLFPQFKDYIHNLKPINPVVALQKCRALCVVDNCPCSITQQEHKARDDPRVKPRARGREGGKTGPHLPGEDGKQYIAAFSRRRHLQRCCLEKMQRPGDSDRVDLRLAHGCKCAEPLHQRVGTIGPKVPERRGRKKYKPCVHRASGNRRSRTLETDFASRDKPGRDGWTPGQSACQVTNSL